MHPSASATLPFGIGLALLRSDPRIVTDLRRWTERAADFSDQSPYASKPSAGVRYVRAMAKYPRVREQHVAVFGEAGSGKTVLVSSFFGRTQEGSFTNDLWDLVADDGGQGTRLYRNFLGMRDQATTPPPDPIRLHDLLLLGQAQGRRQRRGQEAALRRLAPRLARLPR